MLVLRAAGLTRKRIAEELGVSPYTVKAHMASIYMKFGVDNPLDAMRRAGLVG